MKGLINKNTLESLHKKQLERDSYINKPSRMFIDGVFNKKNWNGGDDLIRTFLADVEFGSNNNIRSFESEDCYFPIITNVNRFEDTAYATILVFDDIYYFSWYKNRGTTEIAKKNNKVLEEVDYINLLNLIQETGYDFKI